VGGEDVGFGHTLGALEVSLETARADMSVLYFLRHSYDADWPFLGTNLESFVETHDGFPQDVEEGLVSAGMQM
jgi:hypothetical protein